jgi:predicted small lipoprotein YifL
MVSMSQGVIVMPLPRLSLIRLALAGALVAALGLAACGRKGELELPPSATPAKKAPSSAPGAPPPPAGPPPLWPQR